MSASGMTSDFIFLTLEFFFHSLSDPTIISAVFSSPKFALFPFLRTVLLITTQERKGNIKQPKLQAWFIKNLTIKQSTYPTQRWQSTKRYQTYYII